MWTVIVRTRYSGPTESRGARVRVSPVTACAHARRSKGFPYPYAADDAHRASVDQYAETLPTSEGESWSVEFLGTCTDGRGNLYRLTAR